MVIPKVATAKPLADQIFLSLRDAIMSGSMSAGDRLHVSAIAEQVGTSVMPVREAIRRLEQAGLAERAPNRGSIVKGLSFDELVHVYDVRTTLEAEAAARGASGATPEVVAEMRAHYARLKELVKVGDLIGALDSDEAMLETLYTAGGNPVFVELIRTLWQRCRAYKIIGTTQAFERGDESVWTDAQTRIIEAAGANDAAAAKEATEWTLRRAGDRIRSRLSDQDLRA